MSKLKTVLLITNIPTPYRIPLFNKLSEQLADDGRRLVVLFGACGYAHRKWEVDIDDVKFEYRILDSYRLSFYRGEKVVFTYRIVYPISLFLELRIIFSGLIMSG